MADVVQFSGVTKNNIEPDQVLTEAVGVLDSVLVLGWTKEGALYVAASDAGVGEALLLMEVTKAALIESATA